MSTSYILSRICTRGCLNNQQNVLQQLLIHRNNYTSTLSINKTKIASLFRPQFTSMVSRSFVSWKPTFTLSYKSYLYRLIRNKVTLPADRKVINNVILYKFEKPKFFKTMNGFGLVACAGLFIMVDNLFRLNGRKIFDSSRDWSIRFQENFATILFILTGIISGPLIFGGILYITLRSVKYLILHKGGLKVTMVTYHPWKSEVAQTIPIHSLKCTGARDDKRSYVTLKVRGTRFPYLMDKEGQFVNPKLFDVTAGLQDNRW